MRKILLLIVLFGATITGVRAQVGIGTQDPDKAAQLDITSDPANPGARGLLIPRVTLSNTTMVLTGIAEADMPNSILVFNKKAFTENGKTYSVGYYYWATDGGTAKGKGKWVPILAGEANVVSNFFNTLNTNSSTVSYNSTSNTLSVNVGNGLREYSNAAGKTYIGLGGKLETATTTIELGSNALVIDGLAAGSKESHIVVLDPTTKALKYMEKLNAKQIGATKLDKGKILTVNSSGDVVWTSLSGTNSLDFSGLAGEGLTFNTASGTLDVQAENGIKVDGDKVKLGGALTENTEIDATGRTLAVKGLGNGAATDKLVVTDAAGVLKTVSGVTTSQIVGGASNKGKILTVDGSGNVTWTSLSGTNSLDFSGLAGEGLTFNTASGTLNVQGGNGITVDGDKVNWGGDLTKTATIATLDNAPFEIKPKSPSANSNVVIEKLPKGDSKDYFVVVDKDGRLKKVDPKSAAKIDYTSTPTTTGRNWTVPDGTSVPVNKEIKEITLRVDFGTGKTTVALGNEIANKDNDITSANQISVINIRAIKEDPTNGGTSITQSGTYDPSTGNLTLGMSGSMFTVTHKGWYYIVVEYYKK